MRWMTRVQRVLSWLRSEGFGSGAVRTMPRVESRTTPDDAAEWLRDWIGISIKNQLLWSDARVAFREWREVLNTKGVAVFQFQIGQEAIRGFSVWDDNLPVAAVNTAYTPQARVYTLYHEIGHLLHRTEGACRSFGDPDSAKVERWCDKFAAAFLLPDWETRQSAVVYRDDAPDEDRYDQVREIARRFNTSVRATALRLIELDLADQDLYGIIDRLAVAKFDDFPRRRTSDRQFGQRAPQKRLQHFGFPAVRTLLRGVDSGHITERDVGDFLHLNPNGVTEIGSLIPGTSST